MIQIIIVLIAIPRLKTQDYQPNKQQYITSSTISLTKDTSKLQLPHIRLIVTLWVLSFSQQQHNLNMLCMSQLCQSSTNQHGT